MTTNPDQPAQATQITQEHWTETLAALQLQMTRATFDTWIKDSRFVSTEDGNFTVSVKSAFAQDWLQNRLHDTIRRALVNVTGQPSIRLVIIVDESIEAVAPETANGSTPYESKESDPAASTPKTNGHNPSVSLNTFTANGSAATLPQASTYPLGATEAEMKYISTTPFYRLKMDAGFWLPEYPYDSTYWFRHWKRGAYFLRRRLEGYWLERHAKKDQRSLEDPANHWTPAFRVRYREMARFLGLKKTELVSGGEVECHRCYLARLKNAPLTTCCGSHPFHDWRQAHDGGFRCYHWRPGMLHRLFDESALTIEIIRPTDSPRAHQVWLQVWRVLPFLTPAEIDQHDPLTRKEHEGWMQRFGQDYFGLTLNQWEEFRADKHIPLMPNNQEGRLLHGQPEADPFAPPGYSAGANTAAGSTAANQAAADLPDDDEEG